MANLIIKPSAGGDLKLQDEGSTDAITISTTGNTTLAGTANALGTVATGNISNTAIVIPDGHVKKTWYKGSTRTTALAISNTGTYQDCSCSANIDITSGNYLLLHFGGTVYAATARHWSFNMYVNGVTVGNVGWGHGIYHGNTTISGWMSFGSQTVYPIPSTGTYSCELKANCNVGTISVCYDSNSTSAVGDNLGFGYDGFHWIAQEIQS